MGPSQPVQSRSSSPISRAPRAYFSISATSMPMFRQSPAEYSAQPYSLMSCSFGRDSQIAHSSSSPLQVLIDEKRLMVTL
jgi:hypothetical protein